MSSKNRSIQTCFASQCGVESRRYVRIIVGGKWRICFYGRCFRLANISREYENGIALGTQSQWGWHSIPSKTSFTLNDVAKEFDSCDGTSAPYAVQQSEGRGKEATDILRANPHRLHLGIVGLILQKENGDEVKLSELTALHQELDLWTGKIESSYQVEGNPVKVILFGHQLKDGISARIESPLIAKRRLKVKLSFPYGKDCHVCPGYDWDRPDRHQTDIISSNQSRALIKRQLDSTTYFTNVTLEQRRYQQGATTAYSCAESVP